MRWPPGQTLPSVFSSLRWGVLSCRWTSKLQTLISRLKKLDCPHNFLGIIISDILSLCSSFHLIASSFVKRGNAVVHTIAHLQPISSQARMGGRRSRVGVWSGFERHV